MPQLREGGEARMAKAGMTVADMLNRRDRKSMVRETVRAIKRRKETAWRGNPQAASPAMRDCVSAG